MTYPDALAIDGATYQWRARTEDSDGAVSAWSTPCRFTIDRTRPDAPPTVESERFPEYDFDNPRAAPPGSGEFTFTANGVDDVVGFQYSGAPTARCGATSRVARRP